MYTAKILRIEKDPEKEMVSCDVEFSNGETTTARQFIFGLGFSESILKDQIRQKVAQLEELEGIVQAIPVGVDIDYSRKPEELEAIEFSKKMSELETAKRLLDLGVLTPQEADLTTKQSAIKTLYNKVVKKVK